MSGDLLSRLQTLAKTAPTEAERSIYHAQWVCALARLGQIETARSEIETLRALNTAYAPRLTAWIFLAEGLVDHFESLSVTAADRFKRAHSLAAAMGDAEIRCLAAAWIGASEFLMGRYEAASLHAAEAIQHSTDRDSLALARAHLVLANCLYAMGSAGLAKNHYARARRYAIEARDISMQSAILYNVAAFHISFMSLSDAFGEPQDEQIGTAELELNSISNLDIGLSLESLSAMVPLLRAQLLVIKRQWEQANSLYSECIGEAASHGQQRLAPRYLAEQAHCQAMLGLRSSATGLVDDAVKQLTSRTDLDDRAACHARLSLSLSTLGLRAQANAHQSSAMESRAAFAAFQAEHRARIVSIAGAT